MPIEPGSTLIRHHVFIKSDAPSPDGDRPNLLVFAADISTVKLFHASALISPPREELFLTRDGRADWMFDDKDNVITPAVVGTEGRAVFTLGKENSVIGWGNFEGEQPEAS